MQGYRYDPHTHTSETSKCGHLPAAEVVERYVKNGFSGLVVTDHLHPEYLSRIDTEHDWQKAMDHYLTGYKASKKRGDELGFDVILGAELRFPENDNDYLVYGIDEDWLRSHPYMCCTSAREFYEKFHNDVLIIHAHPYRDGNLTVFEDAVHGSEIINGNPRAGAVPPPPGFLPAGRVGHASGRRRSPCRCDPAGAGSRFLSVQGHDRSPPLPALVPGVPKLRGCR